MARTSLAAEKEQIFSIIKATPGFTASEIRTILGWGPEKFGKVSNCLQSLFYNGFIRKEGTGKNLKYFISDTDHPPVCKPNTPPQKANGTLTPIHNIEIPRSTLKLLVQAHIDADTPLEGPFGKAMLCAMKKLI